MKSLQELGSDYVDLYMFHWPVPDVFVNTWQQMEVLHEEGLARAIGVANCHQHHLEKLLLSAKVVPAVNQFELHPLMSQGPLVEYCRSLNIAIMAYTPIGRLHEKIVQSSVLRELALKYGKQVPQVVLRWHIEKGHVAVPRSTSVRHLRGNRDILDFELTPDEVGQIDGINEDLRLRNDPDNCDFTKL